jgi:hypothetical protein
MARHRFEIVDVDDEHQEILIDGVEIITINHDEDGWDGMRRIRDVVESIAKVIGAQVDRR